MEKKIINFQVLQFKEENRAADWIASQARHQTLLIDAIGPIPLTLGLVYDGCIVYETLAFWA